MSLTMSDGKSFIETITLVKDVPSELWTGEAAFWTFVIASEASTFFATPDCYFAALRTGELDGSFTWKDHASAPVATGHFHSANFGHHEYDSIVMEPTRG